jgi:ribosomal protein S18 acetylase RimI-like enzyme
MSGAEPAFTPPGPDDRAALIDLIRRYHREDGNTVPAETVAASVDAMIGGEDLLRGWLIRIDGAVAGYLVIALGYSIETGGRDFYLDELYLEPAHRGQGVGTQALDFALQASRELGAKRLCLEVERGNSRAKALYERQGFADHGRFLMSRVIDQ